MTRIKKIFKNDYFFNFINKGYTIIVGLLSSAFLTRYLGVEYRGDYAFITQVVAIFGNILGLGIYQSYSYFFKNSDNKKKIFNQYISVYGLQFLIYFLFSIILLVLGKINYLYLLAILILPSQILYQQLEATMAVENIRLKIRLNMILNGVRLVVFLIVFLFIKRSLLVAVIITISSNLLISLAYMLLYKIKPSMKNINFSFIKKIISFSWLPMITSLLITFNYSIDTIMLKFLSDDVSLGIYSVAAGIITYFWFVPDAFKEVLVSRVTREKGTKSTNFAVKLSLLMMLATILVFLFFGHFAIVIFFGKEFSSAYGLTLILSIGGISMIYYKMIGVVLLAEGDTKSYFINLLISALINVAFNFFAIPLWGMYGAAISTVLSYTACGVLFLKSYCKKTNQCMGDVIFLTRDEMLELKKGLKK